MARTKVRDVDTGFCSLGSVFDWGVVLIVQVVLLEELVVLLERDPGQDSGRCGGGQCSDKDAGLVAADEVHGGSIGLDEHVSLLIVKVWVSL